MRKTIVYRKNFNDSPWFASPRNTELIFDFDVKCQDASAAFSSRPSGLHRNPNKFWKFPDAFWSKKSCELRLDNAREIWSEIDIYLRTWILVNIWILVSIWMTDFWTVFLWFHNCKTRTLEETFCSLRDVGLGTVNISLWLINLSLSHHSPPKVRHR